MATSSQNELPLFADTKIDPNVPFLISVLQDRDWTTAREIIEIVEKQTKVKRHDRKVRELAALSRGRVAGGQSGYKLVTAMTQQEYNHWRNWMSSQADEMKRRVIETDKVFYQRKPLAGRPT